MPHEHDYGFNSWDGRGWTGNWSAHFNPYSSRPFGRGGIERYGAYDGNFQAHVPNSPMRPQPIEERQLYGGADGNVYRYSPSGTWERNSGSDWSPAPEAPRVDLDQQAIGRSMGDQRFNNFRSYGGGYSIRAGGAGNFGGGGHFSGGGHR